MSVATATIQTRLVGGTDGNSFNDGVAIGGWPSTQKIDMTHPIQEIQICSGWIVDGITITYQLDNGGSQKVTHGTLGGKDTIKLSKNEVVLAIVGRPGMHAYYKRSMIHQISFAILDTSNAQVRTAGVSPTSLHLYKLHDLMHPPRPFGNMDKSNQGQAFQISRPIALAGYDNGNPKELGLSGLSFIKSIISE